ncbi:MAG: hypothetical protein HZB84_07650 [Deltaproteobacteria bacterium]|nr:hypothetical protein [Deltaproteobacteria bacterium]
MFRAGVEEFLRFPRRNRGLAQPGARGFTQGDFTAYGHPEYNWAYVSEDFMIKGVKKVHVTVTWDGGQGYTIETYRR